RVSSFDITAGCWLRVEQETSAFSLNSELTILSALPCVVRDTGENPEPILQNQGGLVAFLGNMARLNWKSDALATVVRPLPKGTGDPPKRHLRGNFLKTRVECFDSGFFMLVARNRPCTLNLPITITSMSTSSTGSHNRAHHCDQCAHCSPPK